MVANGPRTPGPPLRRDSASHGVTPSRYPGQPERKLSVKSPESESVIA